MKNLEQNSDKQQKNENSNMFSFAKENKMELLNQYQMKQIKGGDGEDDDTQEPWN